MRQSRLHRNIRQQLFLAACGCIPIHRCSTRCIRGRHRVGLSFLFRPSLLDALGPLGLLRSRRYGVIGDFAFFLQRTRKCCRSICGNVLLPRGIRARRGLSDRRTINERACRRECRACCLLLENQSIHGRTPARVSRVAEQQCPASAIVQATPLPFRDRPSQTRP